MPGPESDLFAGETHLVPTAKPSVPAVVAETPANPLLPDMRAALMTLPPAQMLIEGARYIESRKTFRDWLRDQLVQGVHFGYPPGIEPKFTADGDMIQSVKNKQSGQWEKKVIPKESWTAKPSLYKAGADFVCDLLVVRDEYAADMDGWAQLGSPKGVFVYACRLYSRANGDLVGEGRGVRAVGQKGGDENNAIKMAKKSAKVDAVLNAFGLSDLFTQDREEGDHGVKEVHDNPPQNDEAPQPRTRTERQQAVTGGMLKQLSGEWSEVHGDGKFSKEFFPKWVRKCATEAGIELPADWAWDKADQWTTELLNACRKDLP